MKIIINGENIPFELENEKNAFDIVNAISEYAAKATPKQFITEVFINDKEYSFADQIGLSALTVDIIKEIKFELADIVGLTSLSIKQIYRYLSFVEQVLLKNIWDTSFERLEDSINWMKEGINQIVSIFGSKKKTLLSQKDIFQKKTTMLQNLFAPLTKDDFPLKDETKEMAAQFITDLKDILYIFELSIDNSFHRANNEKILEKVETILESIDVILDKLPEIPIMFQTGEDQKAMEVIRELTNILEKCIGLFVIFKESFKVHLDKYTVKEVSFEVFFNTLTDHLKELMNAIENNDSVMIGDLLEYEFVPNMEEIRSIMIRLKEEAFTKAN